MLSKSQIFKLLGPYPIPKLCSSNIHWKSLWKLYRISHSRKLQYLQAYKHSYWSNGSLYKSRCKFHKK